MSKIKTVCVYCGASMRVDQFYRDTATRLGQVLARAGLRVVYGGGTLGLMGIMADSVLKQDGYVIGIIPQLLEEEEGAHTGLNELYVVDSMHTRKRKMSELADAFIILPGGFGTLDELFEILTWRQLELHDKPIVVVNAGGYWDPLKALIHQVVEHNFATPEDAQFVTFVDSPDAVLDVLISAPESDIGFIGQHV